MWINRHYTKQLIELYKTRPALLVTGPRQVGKSSLLRRLFPEAHFVTLDHIATARQAIERPDAFLSSLTVPVLIDEIQYAPELFRELKIHIDDNRDAMGNWILTGSQSFVLMQNVSESLAGRIGIIQMSSLSASELRTHPQLTNATSDILWKGGYPELWAHPEIGVQQYYDDYIQTYLERDLRAILNVANLRDFQRFMRLCATRCGHLLNYSELGKDLALSGTTIKSWISALEASGIITLLPPYYRNLGKRLIKAPKLYFSDNGLLCNLLNINKSKDLDDHVNLGQIWENLVFCELIKSHRLKPGKNLFFYRDQNGIEIDFIAEGRPDVWLIEAKYSENVKDGKLNFKKIAPRFERPVKCSVACSVNSNKELFFADYSVFNPLYCSPEAETPEPRS
jgi:predicted AAA+ superfamily ATPase